MNLQRIKELISKYKKWLQSPQAYDNLYLWESVNNFQENFDLEAEDLSNSFDQALQNSTSRSLWTMDAKFPKEMMLNFMKMDADMVRWTFKDLFRYEHTLDGRLNRFIFHCDEMYSVWKKQNPKAHELGHYHDADHWMSTLYLFLSSPENHCPYQLPLLQKALRKFEAKNIPENEDPERFFKIVKVVNKFIQEDPEILELHQARLDEKHYQSQTLLLAYECLLLVN